MTEMNLTSTERQDMTDGPLLTTGQAATLLHVSSETIRRWAARGLIESQRLPSGQLRIKVDQTTIQEEVTND